MNQPSTKPVTISDLTRMALPLNTEVTGAADTTRLVKWVVILTSLNQLHEQIETGDLVILPPVLQNQASDIALTNCLKGMDKLAAVGLMTLDPLSERFIKKAKKAGLVIIHLPEQANLRSIHQAITSLLIDRQAQVTERSMQLYRQLSEMSREGQGLAAMVEVMSQLTGKVVLIQDKRLEAQALTIPAHSPFDEQTLLKVLGQRDNLPGVLRNRKAAAKARQSHWQQLLTIDESSLARLISPIISGDRARGYLSIVGKPDELDLLDTLTTEHGAAACALEMARAKAISEAKKELRGDFLEGVLAGNLAEDEINRLAGRLDHQTKQPHAVMVFAWDGEEEPSLRRLETAVNWLLSSHSRPALTHIYSNAHICLFQALDDSDSNLSSARQLAQRLREHLQAEYPQVRLLAGLSGPTKTLSEWPEYYRRALQAMQLSQRLGLDEIVEYNSLIVYQLLIELDDLPIVRQFRRQVIGPLDEYDKSHRSSLVQTIDAYFRHHGNISQTAESLYIHRNTLLYRLDRIQDLTGYELDQSDMRLALHLALKLWLLQPDNEQPELLD